MKLFFPVLTLRVWCAVLFTFLVGGAVAPARAQGKSVVAWRGAVVPGKARAGETVAVRITATITPGYHIYSVVPAKTEFPPQQTDISITAKGLTPVGKIAEPTPSSLRDPGLGITLATHHGSPVFTQTFTVPKTAKPGTIPVTASVFYMACTDKACLPPRMEKIPVPAVVVEAGAARATSVAASPPIPPAGGEKGGVSGSTDVRLAAKPDALDTRTPPFSPPAGGIGGTGMLGFLAAAFGAGLVALVTPCVFPLIPVTLAFFTKQVAGENGTAKTGGVVKLAAVYCLGIVLAFTTIGAVLAATVGAAGANRLASNPFVNLGFGVLFVVFALSLLEVVELKPPAFLAKLTSGRTSSASGAPRTAGTWGVLGMGLTFVLAAFTCTAPFIGTVLVAAASAQTGSQWVRPILGMTTFALALALPFFLLALFPALLAKLPKSGAWLSTVKGAMGWIELAAAVKFLSNADQVFEWQLLNAPTMLALWAMVLIAGGFWLLGVLRVGWGAPDAPATPARWGFAGLFFAAGLYCVYGLTGRPLDSFTAAYLPPADYGVGAKRGAEELAYLPTLAEGIAQAKAQNKPIFVDFTGKTCTNCRWMEKYIFPKPEVNAELSRFVRVRLVTDDRTTGAALQAFQERTFGTVELPLYAVLDSSGNPVTKPVGKTDTAQAFADFLRGGRETAQPQAGTSAVARR